MPKADIDFEKELWDAANELRGAVSENNYKNYILPLVFLKHLSERYESSTYSRIPSFPKRKIPKRISWAVSTNFTSAASPWRKARVPDSFLPREVLSGYW